MTRTRLCRVSRAAARVLRRRLVPGLYVLLSMAGAVQAGPPTHLRAPPDLADKVGVSQKLGARIPLDTTFRDAGGKSVQLRDLLQGRPTLLVPGYFGCINLCSVIRSGVAKSIAASGLAPGKQFNVVLVSIDPGESSATAHTAQHNDAQMHAGADVSRWHYLTGSRQASRALMQAIGYRYYHDSRNGQYDHDAAIVLLTSEGRISQYLFGVKFAPETLRLALVQASHGSIGSVVDHFLLLCCNYDPSTGRYSLVIHRVMQILGVLTVLLLLGVVAFFLRIEKRRRRRGEDA